MLIIIICVISVLLILFYPLIPLSVFNFYPVDPVDPVICVLFGSFLASKAVQLLSLVTCHLSLGEAAHCSLFTREA